MDAEQIDDGTVRIGLSKAEALVLFEWLHRAEDEGIDWAGLSIVDQAERRVLWDVSAVLERILTEPFDADYRTLVAQARAEVNGDE